MIKENKGLTLIEMVTIIVVLGLAIPVLLNMWAGVAWRSGRTEALAEATFYAQELMEEIKSKQFDQIPQNEGPPWSTVLGPEGGETYPNFNDVDDFNGYSDSPATGYTRSCVLDYVELSGSTWQAATSPPTYFKRIRVTVSRTDNTVSDVSLVTVVSG